MIEMVKEIRNAVPEIMMVVSEYGMLGHDHSDGYFDALNARMKAIDI